MSTLYKGTKIRDSNNVVGEVLGIGIDQKGIVLVTIQWEDRVIPEMDVMSIPSKHFDNFFTNNVVDQQPHGVYPVKEWTVVSTDPIQSNGN